MLKFLIVVLGKCFFLIKNYFKLHETESQNNDDEGGIFISGGLIVERSSQVGTNFYVNKMTVFKLNVKSKKWEHFTELKSVRSSHQSTIIENQLHLIGGSKKRYCLADTVSIPITKKLTKQTPKFPTMHNKRRYFGMCSFAGCIVVAGGQNNELGYLDKCEVYSFESCEWTEVSSMNTKRGMFALIYFQNKIWAIGGYSGKNFLNTIETYDLAKNIWTTIDTKLLSKRDGPSATVHNTKVFVIGGCNTGGVLSSIEVYSSETNQFSFVNSMSLSRTNFGCCIVNSSIYVIGGILDTGKKIITDEVEIYDIENDVWEKGPSLPLKLTAVGCSSTEK